jgi:hypothetical protein
MMDTGYELGTMRSPKLSLGLEIGPLGRTLRCDYYLPT